MKHIEEKAREAGLKVVKRDSGDIYVEGPAEAVAAFRETFEEAERAAIKNFNQSGIQPVEYKVLVLPDTVEEKTESGLLIKPEIAREKEALAQVKAVLVAMGGNAFEDWADAPKPGHRVYVAKYAGFPVDGADGRQYQLVNDKDIAAIITREV